MPTVAASSKNSCENESAKNEEGLSTLGKWGGTQRNETKQRFLA
jgi:hypothetical protein